MLTPRMMTMRQTPKTDDDDNTKPAYLLYGVEVGVIKVPEEPEDTRAQHLPQQEDEGGEVEDVDHSHQPVDEHGRPWRQVEAGLAVFQCGIKHRLQIRSFSKSFTFLQS